ncbi:MAG: MaoC family dehydratase [Lachnospiraceae bacterium]|nr:MaoC family dehydratase [Lachnospiraceae bacterium]
MNEYCFEDLEVGKKESFSVRITEQMLDSFKDISGDENPLHCDEAFAKEEGYDGRVAYGMLTASFLSTLAGVYLPGRYSLIQSVEIKFAKPVYIGDELTITGEITETNDTYGLIFLKVTITDSSGKKVCRGKMQIGVKKRG